MGVGSRGSWPPWIIIHDADKVEGGLNGAIFSILFFSLPPLWKFFADVLGGDHYFKIM